MPAADPEPLVRVMALHSLTYCARLFYLEEVEEIRLADEAVYAGRTLHEQWKDDDSGGAERHSLELASERLGLQGKIDVLRSRDGMLVPYEHKRGRSRRDDAGVPGAWPSDALQVAAYGMLVEEWHGVDVSEGRVRYHAENVTVRVPITADLRAAVQAAVARARQLRECTERPPVTSEDGKCARCSLAPVCLPEEERFNRDGELPSRLFPATIDRDTVHVTTPGATIRRSGDQIVVTVDHQELAKVAVSDVGAVLIHGNAQITTQAIYLAVDHDIGVHWLTTGGRYIGGLASSAGGVQRRLRQFSALTDLGMCLRLARRLGAARVESQLRFLLRATRGNPPDRAAVSPAIALMRARLKEIPRAEGVASVRGLEGAAGRQYFDALPLLIVEDLRDSFAPAGRSRRPPQDPFNAALSFGYALLYSRMLGAVIAVGLDPSIGFLHTPRSASYPLVLDLMELFRVPVVDMPLVASINRRQWRKEDFAVTRERTWLSESGRRKLIGLFEERLNETWKHPVLDYSLSYARMMELEARLAEKEWTGSPGLFARARLR